MGHAVRLLGLLVDLDADGLVVVNGSGDDLLGAVVKLGSLVAVLGDGGVEVSGRGVQSSGSLRSNNLVVGDRSSNVEASDGTGHLAVEARSHKVVLRTLVLLLDAGSVVSDLRASGLGTAAVESKLRSLESELRSQGGHLRSLEAVSEMSSASCELTASSLGTELWPVETKVRGGSVNTEVRNGLGDTGVNARASVGEAVLSCSGMDLALSVGRLGVTDRVAGLADAVSATIAHSLINISTSASNVVATTTDVEGTDSLGHVEATADVSREATVDASVDASVVASIDTTSVASVDATVVTTVRIGSAAIIVDLGAVRNATVAVALAASTIAVALAVGAVAVATVHEAFAVSTFAGLTVLHVGHALDAHPVLEVTPLFHVADATDTHLVLETTFALEATSVLDTHVLVDVVSVLNVADAADTHVVLDGGSALHFMSVPDAHLVLEGGLSLHVLGTLDAHFVLDGGSVLHVGQALDAHLVLE